MCVFSSLFAYCNIKFILYKTMHVGQTSYASYSSKYLSFFILKQNYKLPLQVPGVYLHLY